MRGRKAQSALEDDEMSPVRAALNALKKPQVHVGEEKIFADRMVKSEDEGDRASEARETIVERRVRANVFRRRTSRTEVAPTEPTAAPVESAKAPVSEPSPAGFETAAPISSPVEPSPSEAESEIETFDESARAAETPAEPERTPPPSETEVTAPASAPAQPEGRRQAVIQAKEPTPQQAPRGARILGRIDLKQTMRIEPAPTPVLRRPAGPAPVQPGSRVPEAEKPQNGTGEQAAGADKPKPGRHKRRVVKKQDVLELREKELRGGRIPK